MFEATALPIEPQPLPNLAELLLPTPEDSGLSPAVKIFYNCLL